MRTMTTMRMTAIAMFLSTAASCGVGPGEARTASVRQGLACGDLCLPGDTVHLTLSRIVSYNYDETLDLAFDAAAGSALVYFDSWGNSGGSPGAPFYPDGLQVAIGDGAMCLSQDRYDSPHSDPERGCESTCSNVVTTVEGTNHVPIHLHQWNGTDGWSADTIDIDVTMQ